MWPIASFGFGQATALADAKGYLKWLPGYVVVVLYVASFAPIVYWSATHERALRFREWLLNEWNANRRKAVGLLCVIVALILVASVSTIYMVWSAIHKTRDAAYIPSTNKLTRFEGNVAQFSTPPQCTGLPEDKERECLCPRSLDYTLAALPTPPDNNYATQINITSGHEDMYRVVIYGRTTMYVGKVFDAIPNGLGKSGLSTVQMDFDRYALGITSSAPEREFRLQINTSEGLRIKCVNQIN